jgi:hypothetical protein
MCPHRSAIAAAAAAIALCAGAIALAGGAEAQVSRPPPVLEPLGTRGEAIFPAFEGWGPDKSGENMLLLLGYYNRNKSQEIVIPIGPDNRIEPDGPDYGQPTHFYTGRQHGVFAIKVPKDFGNKRLTWSITANNQTSTISFWLNPAYWINFYKHAANSNEPPIISLTRGGPTMTGPPLGISQTISATVGQRVPLTVFASDVPEQRSPAEAELSALLRAQSAARTPSDSVAIVGGQVIGRTANATPPAERAEPPDITVNWKKHSGPEQVSFAQERIPLVTKRDPKVSLEASTTATFSAPGDYVIRAQVNDTSGDGGGGEQCCWTTALIRVNVK